MTQAVVRGLDNAFPITTMVDDNRTQWKDSQFEEYKTIIDDEINTIKEAQSKFKGIKFAAQMSFGQGKISNMKQSAPKIWNYLNEKLAEIGIDNTGATPKIQEQPIVKENLNKKELLLNNALNKAIKEYLPDLDYYYLDLPIGLTEKEQEDISFLLFDDGNSKEAKEAFKKYVKRILTKEDLKNAKIAEKNYDWAVYNDEGDSSTKSLIKELENRATTLIDKNTELEGLGFEKLLDDVINDKIDDDFKEIAENKLKEYGLFELINYNPNQLSLFDDLDIYRINLIKENNQEITKEDTDKLPPCIG